MTAVSVDVAVVSFGAAVALLSVTDSGEASEDASGSLVATGSGNAGACSSGLISTGLPSSGIS